MVRTFKDLDVWQKSYLLCLKIYKISRAFSTEEKFGLISQVRRAAISVPSNIAEGFGRKTTREYIYFLYVAYGSLCELETQIYISRDLRYLSNDKCGEMEKILKDIAKMLQSLIKVLKLKSRKADR